MQQAPRYALYMHQHVIAYCCLGLKLWDCPWLFSSLTSHLQSFRKSCWPTANKSRIYPLPITSTATAPAQATIFSWLNDWSRFLISLLLSLPALLFLSTFNIVRVRLCHSSVEPYKLQSKAKALTMANKVLHTLVLPSHPLSDLSS